MAGNPHQGDPGAPAPPGDRPDPRAIIEGEIRAALDAGELERAATVALEAYGSEILRFLVAMQRDGDAAAEVFGTFSEQMWKSLPSFAGDSTFRTWAYTLARRASARYHRNELRRRARQVGLSAVPAVSRVVEQIRSRTPLYLRTEVKGRVAQLRRLLPEEDQTILILRVDRRLAWNEVARILLAEEESPEADAIRREAARLRKRFEVIKKRILEMSQGTPGR